MGDGGLGHCRLAHTEWGRRKVKGHLVSGKEGGAGAGEGQHALAFCAVCIAPTLQIAAAASVCQVRLAHIPTA